MNQEEVVKIITEAAMTSAKAQRDAAAYNGCWDDGGASNSEERLKYWLDGIRFANTGKSKVYKHIIDKYYSEKDGEYQEYLRLKEKFKDV